MGDGCIKETGRHDGSTVEEPLSSLLHRDTIAPRLERVEDGRRLSRAQGEAAVPSGDFRLPPGQSPPERPPTYGESLSKAQDIIWEHEANSWDSFFAYGQALWNGFIGWHAGPHLELPTTAQTQQLAQLAAERAALQTADVVNADALGAVIAEQAAIQAETALKGRTKACGVVAGALIAERLIDGNLFAGKHIYNAEKSATVVADYIVSPGILLAGAGRCWLKGLAMVAAHTGGKTIDCFWQPSRQEWERSQGGSLPLQSLAAPLSGGSVEQNGAAWLTVPGHGQRSRKPPIENPFKGKDRKSLHELQEEIDRLSGR